MIIFRDHKVLSHLFFVSQKSEKGRKEGQQRGKERENVGVVRVKYNFDIMNMNNNMQYDSNKIL